MNNRDRNAILLWWPSDKKPEADDFEPGQGNNPECWYLATDAIDAGFGQLKLGPRPAEMRLWMRFRDYIWAEGEIEQNWFKLQGR